MFLKQAHNYSLMLRHNRKRQSHRQIASMWRCNDFLWDGYFNNNGAATFVDRQCNAHGHIFFILEKKTTTLLQITQSLAAVEILLYLSAWLYYAATRWPSCAHQKVPHSIWLSYCSVISYLYALIFVVFVGRVEQMKDISIYFKRISDRSAMSVCPRTCHTPHH